MTGETVLFSWWVAASARVEEGAGAGLPVDVFDEGDRIFVVADIGGVREEDIVVDVTKDRLALSAGGYEERFREEIALPAEVNPDTLTRSYTNGVLAVSLEKMLARRPQSSNRNTIPHPIPHT